MKKLLLTTLAILTLLAEPMLATPEKPPAIVALLHGRLFEHGGGLATTLWVGLREDGSMLMQDTATRTISKGGWFVLPDKRYVILYNDGGAGRGHIHAGRGRDRFVFGPWECHNGNDGHFLFKIVWAGC